MLADLSRASRSAWAVAFTSKVLDLDGDQVLTLLFMSERDAKEFKNQNGAADRLREVIQNRFGITVKYRARIADAPPPPLPPTPNFPSATPTLANSFEPAPIVPRVSESDPADLDPVDLDGVDFEHGESAEEFDYPPIDAKDLAEDPELAPEKPVAKRKPATKAAAAAPQKSASQKPAAKQPEPVDAPVEESKPESAKGSSTKGKSKANPPERFGEGVLRDLLGAEPIVEKKKS